MRNDLRNSGVVETIIAHAFPSGHKLLSRSIRPLLWCALQAVRSASALRKYRSKGGEAAYFSCPGPTNAAFVSI
jgi:hypothetical protein